MALHATTATFLILCFTRLGAAAGMSLKLGRVGILTSGLTHDASCKHLADFEEEHG